MNFAMVMAVLVLGADETKECVDVPSTPDMRVQQCGKYVFTFGDVYRLNNRPPVDQYFAGIVLNVNSAPVEPKPIEITVGTTKYDGRIGVLSSGSFANSELLVISTPLPGKERVRVLSCLAQVNRGATRDECIKRFAVMRDEAPLPERENVAPSLGGLPVAVPNGCSVTEGAIRCNDGRS